MSTYLYLSGLSDTYPISAYTVSPNGLTDFQQLFAKPAGDLWSYNYLLCPNGTSLFAVNLAGDDLRYFHINSNGTLTPVKQCSGCNGAVSICASAEYVYVTCSSGILVFYYDEDTLTYLKTITPSSNYIDQPVAMGFSFDSTNQYLVGSIQDDSKNPTQWAIQSYFPTESDLHLVSECKSHTAPISAIVTNISIEVPSAYFCFDKGICRTPISDGVLGPDIDVLDCSTTIPGKFLTINLSSSGNYLYALEKRALAKHGDGYESYVHSYELDDENGEPDYLGKSQAFVYDAGTSCVSPDSKHIYLPCSYGNLLSSMVIGANGIATDIDQTVEPGDMAPLSLAMVSL